jgi:hypothetical protein
MNGRGLLMLASTCPTRELMERKCLRHAPGSVQDIVDALRALTSDRAIREALGRGAPKQVEEHSASAIGSRHLASLNEVSGVGPTPARRVRGTH